MFDPNELTEIAAKIEGETSRLQKIKEEVQELLARLPAE